ncbi:type VI secretion system baseplate subunit TssF [Rhodospirillaceae bacterium SYSU D60014]|uniref:type VI secretion system baseplate subunit TssF n=1 Tax=Virgifigura deserti TaxID=2268457 RepID=UPI000E674F4A
MVDELLPYYNRELAYIRRLAAEFAEAHPKIAGRLRLSADAIEDPHVGRLVESFAFLNARIRHKLDDDFPELTDALLNVLYPHYLAPVPSMAIVQFACQPDLAGAYTVPAGVEIETEPVGGETCRFRTCYPTTLWPIALQGASLTGRPLVAPAASRAGGAVATLRLRLRCLAEDMTFTQLAPDSLRFFLRGQPQQVFPLYELILNNTLLVALADSANDPNPVFLDPDCIRAVGFERDEGMLPYPARSFIGYRLLTEFFAFPEKFLFFDLTRLSGKVLLEAGNKLEIFFYLNSTSAELERSVSAESFALGCAPIVNLFRQRAEPIQLTQADSSYRVVPDARRPAATEIYSIDRVSASSPSGEEVTFRPFYSVKHAGDPDGPSSFWHPMRCAAGARDPGTDMFLSLVDLDFNPAAPADWIVSVDTTCLNRDLPAKLPYGGGHPHLQLAEGASAVTSVTCITPPTPTLRPPMREGGRWRLISHLTLGHLSLIDHEEGADALREILKLYDFRDSQDTRAIIDSVLGIRSRRGTARAPSQALSQDAGAFCRGVEIDIEFDDRRFSESGLFLLASVLERFLALYASINSFTRLTAKVRGRPGILRKWRPRAGDRILL